VCLSYTCKSRNLILHRYINTDLIVHLLLSNLGVPHLFLSYDIMCQYITKFLTRMPFSEGLARIQTGIMNFDVAVPKFHLPAHVKECHADYSLNNLPGVGRLDGEVPERNWAMSNKASGSTVDMGPGARKDTLNGFFGSLNWRRITRMGRWLLSSL
jgi:hypothetical protein